MTHSGSIADAFGIVAVGHTDMQVHVKCFFGCTAQCLHGVNLAAVAGNGRRVVTNLLDALTPIIREGAERSMEEKADKAVQTAKANRAARRAAAKK